MNAVAAWLALVQHDLVKRLLWPARDRRDLGGVVRPGELVVGLTDETGTPTGAAALWRRLVDDAPAELVASALAPAALAAFGRALDVAVAAAAGDELDGVLALGPAFAALTRALAARPTKGEGG